MIHHAEEHDRIEAKRLSASKLRNLGYVLGERNCAPTARIIELILLETKWAPEPDTYALMLRWLAHTDAAVALPRQYRPLATRPLTLSLAMRIAAQRATYQTRLISTASKVTSYPLESPRHAVRAPVVA